ncbi:2-amino-4-hydroxy-6-hydroxymethyldihydropteridine diphosphokinase [Taibaiella sp. KBW10]|uniref:2-amino-4-hydroxy-6- hydroxymethyldihydropteridine diphosphokinase n=1 Tax=Taibaiella sp. KBW10 TaxID=2153357 RepID=UPI000F592C10|nr:2-amino-4-hydroxy-6-hydroxymethyldihydropteridine diphosphokinase [Taibaiella sp. KBW10]RQO32683.1 2-amino-4-hydroxy-6-hydroxymethyldihydropteridine diphosphokinase [Taibaiella sp. KBW10]
MNTAYLLLGGNEGDRLKTLRECVAFLCKEVGTVISASPIYETAAWGKEDLPAHLNQAIKMETDLSATALLQQVLAIEIKLGRQRQEHWGCRTIDIDIIFFNEDVVQTRDLVIPHPLMQVRRFVLQPLSDIAGAYIHPVLHQSVATLLAQCTDPLAVTRYTTDLTADALL